MKTSIETLVKALRVLSREVISDDGVANACIAEAADRIEELDAAKRELTNFLRKAKDLAELSDLYGQGVAMGLPKEQAKWKPQIENLQSKIDAAIAKHGEQP